MPGKNTNYQITTTLAIDGEKAFKAAMDDANRAMRVHDADLKAMAAEYNYAGDQQRYFAQRAETTAEKVKQQEAIVEALNRAVKESGDKFGDAAKQTDSYRIKLSNATAKLFDMRKEAETANRELEELGRDSGKIGRQIKNGIGDAAEDTTGKLRNMFEQAAQDVRDLKSGVAFQTAMNVGGFVFDSIQSVMGFVQENQEYNRRLAQARTVIESYGFVNEEIIEITKYAASITGDFETALEALVNLSGSGFESEEQIKATVQALLGGWVSAGGTMDFSGLAEDFLETVKTKTPSGLFAELVTKFTGRTVEDVQKILESMTSQADVVEAATAILTEAGLQTKVEEYVNANADVIRAERVNLDIQQRWANIARDLQPYTTGLLEVMDSILSEIENFLDKHNIEPKPSGFLERVQIANEMKKEAEKLENKGNEEAAKAAMTALDNYKKFSGAMEAADFFSSIFNAPREWFANTFGGTKYKHGGGGSASFDPMYGIMDWILPSAGAETLPTEELNKIGFAAAQEIANGMMAAPEGTTALAAAMQTMTAELYSETLREDAKTSGKNLMTAFGNGIAEGMSIPLQNAQDLVAQINATLAGIATPAFGLGWSGISGGNIALYMDSQKVGQLTAGSVSTTIGRKIDTKMMVK